MKRFLTGLGAMLIMLATLTVCHAQNLVGLPQYGVMLGGTAGDPSIVNTTSGKTILGGVVLFVAQDGGPNWRGGYIRPARDSARRRRIHPGSFLFDGQFF
jgi:hypothetical protein